MYKAEIKSKNKLDLSGQNLQILPCTDFDLEILIADNNCITSLINLPETLRVLSLVRNKIAFLGNIERQTPYLSSLNLSSNRLISLEGISACMNLQELRLPNNYIGDDQISLLQNLKNLKIIDISHNHLRDVSFFKILEKLTNLEELWNSANDFGEWVLDFPMVNLKKLVLDSNKIKTLEFRGELPSLQVLSCKENNITSIKGIQNAKNLYEAELSSNDISTLSSEWAPLPNLRILSMKNNSISNFPFLDKLEVLDLCHNSLTSLPDLSTILKELFISNNSIQDLPLLPSSLITVDLSYNKLVSLTAISSCSSLQFLNASYNLLTNPKEVHNSLKNTSLLELDMRGMDLSKSVYEAFISDFQTLQMFNGEDIRQGDAGGKKQASSLRTSTGWDKLSKSKLFPSCRSSLAEVEKGTPNNNNPLLSEFSIFSDIKENNSLGSSMNSLEKRSNHEGDRGNQTYQDSEYELLAKELEINKRIYKLDLETRFLGDSLISKKEYTGEMYGMDKAVGIKRLNLQQKGKIIGEYIAPRIENQGTDSAGFGLHRKSSPGNVRIFSQDKEQRNLGDSLISKKSVSENERNTMLYHESEFEISDKKSEKFSNNTFGDSFLSRKNNSGDTDFASFERKDHVSDFSQRKMINYRPETLPVTDKEQCLDRSASCTPAKIPNYPRPSNPAILENLPPREDLEKALNIKSKPIIFEKPPPRVDFERLLNMESIPDYPQRSCNKIASPKYSRKEVHRPKDPIRVNDREDSTISFEISNDYSRERPPREPLRTIYDSHRSKKAKCCKHCCRKRKRSVNLQTTMKDQAPVTVKESVPRFIDQATSPMNSLMHCTPIYSQKSCSIIASARENLESRPQSLQKTPEHLTRNSSPQTNRSFFNETPAVSNRNRSFITNTHRDEKETVGKTAKRAATPLISYRNSVNLQNHTDIGQIINYACTPPRPILASEANTPIFCMLSNKGTEFFLISQMFVREDRRIKHVMKTYTYSLQKSMQLAKAKTFLQKENKEENLIMFYEANEKELEIICKSPEGFSAVYGKGFREIILTSDLTRVQKDKNISGVILVVMVHDKSVKMVRDNVYQLVSLQNIAPIYFVEFY